MEEKRVKKHSKNSGYMIIICVAALVVIMALICFIVSCINGGNNNVNSSDTESSAVSSLVSSSESVSSAAVSSKATASSKPVAASTTSVVKDNTPANLDPEFSNLLLVNGDNPLPDNYDANVRKDLVEIDAKYRNNNYVTQIHKDVYPYITAMVASAQADGVDLRVWSPFRSYAIQNDLFQKQVARVGGDEAKAATVVARPGTSEHNTGLCADFNMASDAFENTEMYTWMKKNAENYGFIMRYSAEKQPITGVIHESWHWRFVGINHAKKINELGMCLEEYVYYLEGNISDVG